MTYIGKAREDRGRGIPLSDAERQERHYEQTGEWLLPQRGTGLSDVYFVNPTQPIPMKIAVGALGGALVGSLLSKDKKLVMALVLGIIGGLIGWGFCQRSGGE